MAIPLALIAAGASFAGGIMNGLEQERALNAQAKELGRQAKDAERIGRIESEQIRKEGRSVLGEAVVQLASSGMKVDTGSAIDIKDYITTNAAQDAMNAVLTRADQAFSARMQAVQARRQARGAVMGGILGGIGGAASILGR